MAAVTLSNNPQVNPNPEEGEVDVLVCMTPQMYYEKRHFIKKGGLEIVDTLGMEIQNGEFQYTLVTVPASSLATSQAKEKRSANMVFLGVLNQHLELFDDASLEKTISLHLPKAAETNIKAYRAGKEFLTSGSKQSR